MTFFLLDWMVESGVPGRRASCRLWRKSAVCRCRLWPKALSSFLCLCLHVSIRAVSAYPAQHPLLLDTSAFGFCISYVSLWYWLFLSSQKGPPESDLTRTRYSREEQRSL